MNEAEIDALMAGQEDENGCVNYEGKLALLQFPASDGTSSSSLVCPLLSFPSSCCSLCQAHHVCVRTLPPPTIVHGQTPWCRDIHSLFPVPPEEAGEQKRTMRCQFLNPFDFVLFFVQMVLFCFSASLQHFWNQPPFSLAFFFFFCSSLIFLIITGFSSGTVIFSSITWHKDDHPLPSKPFFFVQSLCEVTGFDQDWLINMNPLHP